MALTMAYLYKSEMSRQLQSVNLPVSSLGYMSGDNWVHQTIDIVKQSSFLILMFSPEKSGLENWVFQKLRFS